MLQLDIVSQFRVTLVDDKVQVSDDKKGRRWHGDLARGDRH